MDRNSKFLKQILVVITLFIPFLSFSQKSKELSFKTISFIQKDSITNLDEYKKGMIERLKNTVEKLPLTMDEKTLEEFDSLSNSISQKELDKYIKTFHYKKINDSILKDVPKTTIQ